MHPEILPPHQQPFPPGQPPLQEPGTRDDDPPPMIPPPPPRVKELGDETETDSETDPRGE
jgi:hypothetical protein